MYLGLEIQELYELVHAELIDQRAENVQHRIALTEGQRAEQQLLSTWQQLGAEIEKVNKKAESD